jgi:galactose mutarotase-like enzyme
MSRSNVATPPGIVELNSENARVAFVPALGGRVIALDLGGRQWLADGDRGGIVECFPTIAACTISSGIPSLGGQTLPAGGEIASRAPSFTMETHDADEGAAALRALMEWTGERAPWRYARELRVAPDAVIMRYALTNEGKEKLPFLWAARAALPLGEATTLELPDSSRVRIGAQHGIDLLGVSAEHRWPKLRSAKAIVDFSKPDAVARKFSCTLFVDLASGRASVTEGPHRLHVEFDATRLPHFEVSVDRRGWAPFGSGSNTSSVVIAPRMGVPDSLSEALGSWNGAQWVAPGETREWEVVYRGERLK